MNIAWVIAEHGVLPWSTDPHTLSNIAPTWGSWRHIRSLMIDNAVCYNTNLANQLISQGYWNMCNLWVPTQVQKSNQPASIRAFGGSFDLDIASVDDIVALHLVAVQSQVVLLFGFDLSLIRDRSQRQKEYINLIKQTISDNPDIQWVIIDPLEKPDSMFDHLSNLSCDSFENVLNLLSV